jgi:hypothetical protein
MGLDDVPGDIETQAQATAAAQPALPVPFEDVRHLLFGYPFSGIRNLETHSVSASTRHQADHATAPGELERISDEVRKNLDNFLTIQHRDQPALHIYGQLYVAFSRLRRE